MHLFAIPEQLRVIGPLPDNREVRRGFDRRGLWDILNV
jgi:hypothetical protein